MKNTGMKVLLRERAGRLCLALLFVARSLSFSA